MPFLSDDGDDDDDYGLGPREGFWIVGVFLFVFFPRLWDRLFSGRESKV